jgi:hypothetical protein
MLVDNKRSDLETSLPPHALSSWPCTQSRPTSRAAAAVPPSLAAKSREELQQLVLGLIKKSKAADKRIEGACV